MKKLIPMVIAIASISTLAMAQTTPSQPATPTTPPAATTPSTPSTPMTPSATAPSSDKRMTDEQARAWVDKPVYSSDGKSIGEVATFVRDASGNVTELHADIGGFLGLGETRVRLMPAQFTMAADRVNISLTSEQAKALPRLAK